MRILVVSKMFASRGMVVLALKEGAFTILEASSGAEALGILEDTHCESVWVDPFELDMGGLELIIKAREMFPGLLTVLLASSLNDPYDPLHVTTRVAKPLFSWQIQKVADELLLLHGG